MEKKAYNKPVSETTLIEVANLIAASSKSVSGNAGFTGTVSGGSGPNRARRRDVWDNDWE